MDTEPESPRPEPAPPVAPPAAPPVAPAAAPVAESAPAAAGGWTRFKERLWSWRAMLAVAVAMVIIGGLGGLSLGLLIGGGHHRHGFREWPGGTFRQGPPGFGPGPGNGPFGGGGAG